MLKNDRNHLTADERRLKKMSYLRSSVFIRG